MVLPPTGDLLAALHVVAIPMRVPFRGVTTREVALLEGPAGWGEFGPFLEYGPVEASRWLASAVESAWVGWPRAVRDRVPVNATVPAVEPERVADVLARFPGCTTAKVKVAERGQSLADDVSPGGRGARGDGVRRAGCGSTPTGRGRSTTPSPRWLAWRVYDLEYAEQPCATVEELRDLRIALARNGVDVPIAADESIRKADDPLRVRDLEAADVVVVKVAPLGGVASALAVVEACGLPAVVSSALDTSVGISAGVALAAALPSLEHACGLGTVALLAGDVAVSPLVPVAGALAVGRVAVDPDRLAAVRRAPRARRVVARSGDGLRRPPARGVPMIDIRWAWVFLDTPRRDAPRSWAFWSAVTGWPLSATRGDSDEFATLLPARGDAWLKVQAVDDGPGGIHLDLDVDDVAAAANEAERLGARRIGAIGEAVVVLRSPGGLTFCLTTWHGRRRAGA